MKLELTTWQRVNCINIIGSIGGANAAMFRKAVKLLDILEMTDDEKEQVGFVDDTAELECDLSGLKSRFGIDIKRVWIGGDDDSVPERRPGDVFIAAQLSIGQTSWSDQERRWAIEIADGDLMAMLKEQVAAYKWQRGVLAMREQRVQAEDLLDQLGIEDGE